jgi:dihydrolipoamide dehydrogenase
MKTSRFDVAVIGAGSAGMRAYREASKVTDSVVLIEGDRYGTMCARSGCMPSKLLIAAAEAAAVGSNAHMFGVHFDKPRIDDAAVLNRVRAERDRFVGFVIEEVENWPEKRRVMATATFLSDHELKLSNGERIVADRIVIATGSSPHTPDQFRGLEDRLMVSDDVFEWVALPGRIAVFGAGPIGLELGQALHRLGVTVSIFGSNNNVGPLTDPEVLSTAREIFGSAYSFYSHAEITEATREQAGIDVRYVVDGKNQCEKFDFGLVATGRRPNVQNLGLENTTLTLDERGVPVFDPYNMRCGDSHIFIAGDVANFNPLLHEAADEGSVAGYNAGHYPDVRRFAKSAPISVVFSDPQIMMIGESYRDLTDRDAEFRTGSVDWSDQGRARVMGVNQGLLKVYGENNTGKLLGAEMIGPRAEHIAHLLAWACQSGLSVSEILERPFYHPVFEEGVRIALRNLNYALGMGPLPPPRCIDCGPGG